MDFSDTNSFYVSLMTYKLLVFFCVDERLFLNGVEGTFLVVVFGVILDIMSINSIVQL